MLIYLLFFILFYLSYSFIYLFVDLFTYLFVYSNLYSFTYIFPWRTHVYSFCHGSRKIAPLKSSPGKEPRKKCPDQQEKF